ncbi:uncharacterized protein TRIADDRAFT_54772 [Trichoplax adhaerens]|uniref:Importin N-terminal domain-containing protein n=1 Tax=Trichoplax adhaerens TaxID=10228 RepID=B3RSY5_TRIAD|nr:hypothetical protein TRIADDRAFT_54772 [Trichoplax adhaerens]EDV27129.1 hypothetical protein TRIADDRAFT_54772 [Trichoplax adhaerens]|eukprot:XP_002111125.1 hypothetical protein TRIADDRAFT_54772 [Trichoplax adhaerens]
MAIPGRPTINELVAALEALYVHNVEKASKWLEEFQKSVYAWELCDELLHKSTNETYTYFAANTMKSKIEYSFNELPVSSHGSLRNSLIDHCKRLHAGSPSTVTQLCIALADLAIQMDQWNDAVQSLIVSFASEIRYYPILLETLEILPQEIESEKIRVGENRRTLVTTILRQSSTLVFEFLSKCMEMVKTDSNICVKTLACLASWFQLGPLISEQIILSNFLEVPFQILLNVQSNMRIYEAASRCICGAATVVEDYEKYQDLAKALLTACHQLANGAFQEVLNNKDMERAGALCHIFTELGISFHRCMIDTPNQGLGSFNLLEMISLCSEYGNISLAQITFDFWFCLADSLFDLTESDNTYSKPFEPYIFRLLDHLCRLCQRCESEENEILADDDTMIEFRRDVEDILHSIKFVVGGAVNCFTHVCQNTLNSANTWVQIEAAFFILGILAESLLMRHAEAVVPVIDIVISSPSYGLALKQTCLKLLEKLCFVFHQEAGRAYLSGFLSYTFNSLQESALTTQAADTIESACKECKEHMYPHLNPLIEAIQFTSVSDRNANKSALSLIKGAMEILSNVSVSNAYEILQRLGALQLETLQQIAQVGDGASMEKSLDPVPPIDRLSHIFRFYKAGLNPSEMHPCLSILENAWPILSRILNKYKNDVIVLEHTCTCIRFAIRCVSCRAAKLLAPIAEQLVSSYAENKHSCFLYLSSILVDEFASESIYENSFRQMLEIFCRVTSEFLNNQADLIDNPATVDDLFRLTARYLQRCPRLILTAPAVNFIVGCGLAAATLQHRDAHDSALIVFCDLIECIRYRESLPGSDIIRQRSKELVDNHGQALVKALIDSVADGIPKSLLSKVAEVLLKLRDYSTSLLSEWVKATLSSLNTVTETGSVIATPEQLNQLYDRILRYGLIYHK